MPLFWTNTMFHCQIEFVTRARRRYSGTPDGLVQMSLVNFKFGGSSTENLGGGATSTIWNDKKRKVEHEPEQYLRIKKRRPAELDSE